MTTRYDSGKHTAEYATGLFNTPIRYPFHVYYLASVRTPCYIVELIVLSNTYILNTPRVKLPDKPKVSSDMAIY